MIRITEVMPLTEVQTEDILTLPHDKRERSRQHVRLDSGREAGLFLPRGTVLRDGDVLLAEDGTCVLIRAKEEKLSEVRFTDATAMAKACFHLGNRHVSLEITDRRILYAYDPVVDEMLRGMGLVVDTVTGPFHPEAGAYHMPEILLVCEPVPPKSRK